MSSTVPYKVMSESTERTPESDPTIHETDEALLLETEEVTVMASESLESDVGARRTLETSSNIDVDNRHTVQPATHHNRCIMEGVREQRTNGARPLRWDTTVIDKVLYLFTPLILLSCGLILLFLITPLAPPNMSIACWHPAYFSADWRAYGDQQCLSKVKTGGVYHPMYESLYEIDEDLNISASPSQASQAAYYDEVFNQTVYPSPPVVLIVFVMAMMCVLPTAVWRSFGQVDATDLITKDVRESRRVPRETESGPRCFRKTDSIQCMGFVGSKLLAAGICSIMLVLIYVVNEQGRQYTLKNEEYTTPIDEEILCNVTVRRLGDNLDNYTVQCLVSSNRDGLSLIWHLLDLSHIILPLLRALAALLVLVFLSQAVNALIITMALLKSFKRPFRQLIINRYSGEQEQIISDVMDEMIGPYGVFVTVMAVRCGETQRITEIYQHVAAKAKLELDKLD